MDLFAARAIRPGRDLRATLTVPAGKDYDLQVLDQSGTQVLAWSHQGPGRTEQVSFRNNTCCNQDYRLRIVSFDGSFSTTEQYTLFADKSF